MEKSTKDSFELERRSGKDRRNRGCGSIRSLIFGGRREEIRRQDDNHRIFVVDRYSTRLFGVIVAILFLSVIDALLTLFLIDHGAYEVNPIMAYYLSVGPYTFFIVKYGLTSLAVFILLIFKNTFLRSIGVFAHSLFYFIAGVFLIVVVWELHLFFRVKHLV